MRTARRAVHSPLPDMAGTAVRSPPATRVVDLVLRSLTAGALAVSAYVHADLAPLYDPVRASVSQGNLFRIDAAAAALAALIVLAVGPRTGFGLAFVVAASSLAAILLYRYVNVGQLGPLPNM